MTLNDYIERVKSVEMTGKPIDAYCKLLAITSDYCDDTGDTGLTDLYDDVDRLIVYDEVKDILRSKGWEAVWKYLRTIPEESINDPLYRVKGGCLYPIDWGDVVELQRDMLRVLQSKQLDPFETYIKKIKDIKIDSNNPRLALFNLSNLVYAYGADTYDSSLADYYVSHFTSKDQAEDFIPEIARSDGLEGVWKYVRLIPEDSIKEDVFCSGGDYNEGYSLRPVTWDAVVELQTGLIKLLKQKKEEKKNEA